MRSVAEQLRHESQQRLLEQSPQERVRLALRLGDDDIALLCARRGITPDDARALVRRIRRASRVRSACAER